MNWAIRYLKILVQGKKLRKISDILIKGRFCQNTTRIKGRSRRLWAAFGISICVVSSQLPQMNGMWQWRGTCWKLLIIHILFNLGYVKSKKVTGVSARLCISNVLVNNSGEKEAHKECGDVVLWSIWQRSVISLLENPPLGNVAPLEVLSEEWI